MKQNTHLEKLKRYIAEVGIKEAEIEPPSTLHEKNEFNEKRDIVSEAERIFGVKATKMTPEDVKIHEQVSEKALVYVVKKGRPEILLNKRGVHPSSVTYDKETM